MAATKYTYSIQHDTKNGKMDAEALESQIRSSAIIIAIDYINTDGDDADIWFKTILSAEDVETLNAIVAAHDGNPLDPTETKKDVTGKIWEHQTSRPLGLDTYFTSRGDDRSNPSDCGHGTPFKIMHKIGDDCPKVIYLDFNILLNKTFIHEGYIEGCDAQFDSVRLEIVPDVFSAITPGTNTPYFNTGEMILPAPVVGMPGNCEIDLNELYKYVGGLIYIPDSDLGDAPGCNGHTPAFWNADYDSEENRFDSLSPAYDGKGRYNIFTVEKPLQRFVNDTLVNGSPFYKLQASDTAEVGHGMRLRATAITEKEDVDDHNWTVACVLTMHRDHTV